MKIKNILHLQLLTLLPLNLVAQDTYVAPDVNIISVSPVQGSGLNIDRVPGKVQSINEINLAKKIFQLQKHLTEKQQVFLCLT